MKRNRSRSFPNEGVQTFAERDIRCALQRGLDNLVASHPEATLAESAAAL